MNKKSDNPESEPPSTIEPAPEPSSLEALREAVDFVAEGKELSSQFLSSLSRQLTNLQERKDIVAVAVDSHQMQRLAGIFERIAKVEGFLFENTDDKMSLDRILKMMEPKDVVRLLTSLYREANVLSRYQKAAASEDLGSAPEAIEDTTKKLTEEQKEAQKVGHGLNASSRARIKEFMDSLVNRAAIEMKETPKDDSSD